MSGRFRPVAVRSVNLDKDRTIGEKGSWAELRRRTIILDEVLLAALAHEVLILGLVDIVVDITIVDNLRAIMDECRHHPSATRAHPVGMEQCCEALNLLGSVQHLVLLSATSTVLLQVSETRKRILLRVWRDLPLRTAFGDGRHYVALLRALRRPPLSLGRSPTNCAAKFILQP